MRALALCLVFAFVLPGCAGDKALLVTGESLVSLADQFTTVAAAMDKAVEAKSISFDKYQDWAAFGRKFQASYPLAVHLWQVAADHRDDKMQAQLAALVAQLGVDLAGYAALVGVKP